MSQNEMHFDVAIIGAGFSGRWWRCIYLRIGVTFRINWGWRGILEINRASKKKVGRRGG
jgi:hypothetical protein